MDEPVDVDELILPLGVGTTPGGPHSPSTRGTPRQTSTNAAEQQEGTNQQQPEKPFVSLNRAMIILLKEYGMGIAQYF
jgi:hypothetical protein